MFKRIAVASALLAAGLPFGIAAEADFQGTTAPTMYFERITDGPAVLKVFAANFIGGRPSEKVGPEVMVGFVGVRDGVVPEVVPFAQTTGSGDAAPALHANGQRVGCDSNGCGALGTVGSAGRTLELRDSGEADPGAFDRVYVVQANDKPDVQYDADGWRLVVKPLAFRYVTARQSTAAVTGGLASGVGVEADAFTRAELQGGPHGSLATAFLPCGLVSKGTGRLTDGTRSAPASCDPTTIIGAGLAAPTATNWTFLADGAAVGQSAPDQVRLLVIDLPKPDEAPTD